MLVHVAAPMEHRVLGGTVDDAAGECFDKVAKLIRPAVSQGRSWIVLRVKVTAVFIVFPVPS